MSARKEKRTAARQGLSQGLKPSIKDTETLKLPKLISSITVLGCTYTSTVIINSSIASVVAD